MTQSFKQLQFSHKTLYLNNYIRSWEGFLALDVARDPFLFALRSRRYTFDVKATLALNTTSFSDQEGV